MNYVMLAFSPLVGLVSGIGYYQTGEVLALNISLVAFSVFGILVWGLWRHGE